MFENLNRTLRNTKLALRARTQVRLYEVIDDEAADHMYLVLSYVDGGQAMEWNTEKSRYLSTSGGGTIPEKRARMYVVFERGVREFQSLDVLHFFMFDSCDSNYKNITRIVHSYRMKINARMRSRL